MTVCTLNAVTRARVAFDMSDRELIAFATEILTGIYDVNLGMAITAASNEVGHHGQMLCRAAFDMESE